MLVLMVSSTQLKKDPEQTAAQLIAEAPDAAWLRAVADTLDRELRLSPLQRIQRLWGLSSAEAASLFGVSRQAYSKWLKAGVPAERSEAVADLAAATDLLDRYLKRERIPAVVRRSAAMLGNRTLIDLARAGDYQGVREAVASMFDLRRVQP